MDDWSFWVGLAVGVPVSILANMATRPTESVVAKFSKRMRHRLSESELRRQARAQWYADHPEVFGLHLLDAVRRFLHDCFFLAGYVGLGCASFALRLYAKHGGERFFPDSLLKYAGTAAGAIGSFYVLLLFKNVMNTQILLNTVLEKADWPLSKAWEPITSRRSRAAASERVTE